VRDIKVLGIQEGEQDLIFTPLAQTDAGAEAATLVTRTTGNPLRVAADVRAVIRSVDPKLPQYDVTTMETQLANSLSKERLLAILASAFGLLALGLAAIGLYGVLSYGVAQRTGEIGVRMALGAQRPSILWMILGETSRLVAFGIPIGLGFAIAGARALAGMRLLYGVTPADPWAISMAVAILVSVAPVAGWPPAQRASRVDPMVALRDE
jgi:ABC-type antimicrobial peptide transport system permease subunit